MAPKTHKQESPQEVPAQPQQPPAEAPVSSARIWAFWCAVAGAVLTARALNQLLPGTAESVIERWVMLGFAVFLGLFLFKLK